MDVFCYGFLEKIYNNLCYKLMREFFVIIIRYNVCEVVGKVYIRVFFLENIQFGFRKLGIYFLNFEVIRMEYLVLVEVFK